MSCCAAALPLQLHFTESPPSPPSPLPPCLAAAPPPSPPVQVGCAGRKLTDISHAQEVWLEFAAVRFGYGRVTVDSGFSLLFELVGEGECRERGVRASSQRGVARKPARAAAPARHPAAAAAAGAALMVLGALPGATAPAAPATVV